MQLKEIKKLSLKRIGIFFNRYLKKNLRLRKIKKLNIQYISPDFLYFSEVPKDAVVVDVGCGFQAEFSTHMMTEFGIRCYGVDPTRKHFIHLKEIQYSFEQFTHLPFAVSSKKGEILFYESLNNESGSILDSHINVREGLTTKYNVKTLTLRALKKRIGADEISILKLDLEGAEYELFKNLTQEDLDGYKQIFVEFHHHCVKKYKQEDTEESVKKMTDFGYKSFSLDDLNYLFYL
tara:strand:- start:16883 stop:17587 length:705 start_codon:yes stop_codon:yes gene_type:complete